MPSGSEIRRRHPLPAKRRGSNRRGLSHARWPRSRSTRICRPGLGHLDADLRRHWCSVGSGDGERRSRRTHNEVQHCQVPPGQTWSWTDAVVEGGHLRQRRCRQQGGGNHTDQGEGKGGKAGKCWVVAVRCGGKEPSAACRQSVDLRQLPLRRVLLRLLGSSPSLKGRSGSRSSSSSSRCHHRCSHRRRRSCQ